MLSALLAGCGATNGGGAASDAGAGAEGAPPAGDSGAPWQGAEEQGVATYYDATGAGNCSFDPSPNDLMVAAMDAPEYAGSAVCGECVHVVGPKGAVDVRIVDQCPGCEKGHLDLSKQAFAGIADLSAGRVPITWQPIACATTGNVAYRFKEGSSQYWTAIQVRNHRLPIAKLEYSVGGGAQFTEVMRADYNYFVIASGVGTTGPFAVRVTSVNGEVLTDTLGGVMPAVVVSGAAQFP